MSSMGDPGRLRYPPQVQAETISWAGTILVAAAFLVGRVRNPPALGMTGAYLLIRSAQRGLAADPFARIFLLAAGGVLWLAAFLYLVLAQTEDGTKWWRLPLLILGALLDLGSAPLEDGSWGG